MKEKKSITYLWRTLKILIFLSFMYTAGIMFKLKNITTAILILFAVSLFIVFNKLDSIDRKIKLLEDE